jgi:predicted transport protein
MSQDQGYIIEFHQIGNVVKVSAMDPRTLTEVSIVGAPGVGDAELTRLAVRKLEYVMAKRGDTSQR